MTDICVIQTRLWLALRCEASAKRMANSVILQSGDTNCRASDAQSVESRQRRHGRRDLCPGIKRSTTGRAQTHRLAM